MKKDYNLLAEKVLDLVGGTDNVQHLMHCATRLRFTLNDIEIARENKEEIEKMEGIVGVIIQNGQYQVCIGPDVGKVCNIIQKQLEKEGKNQEVVSAEKTEGSSNKKGMDRVFEVISGIFTPVVPVLMASGMMGAILTILKLVGVLSETSSTYYVLNVIYDAGFYFLPIFIGYTASKKFNTTPFLGMLLACIMIHPNIVDFSSLGVEQLSIFNISIPAVAYGKTVLPIIIGVWIMSYVEKGLNKIMPAIVRSFMVPVLCMLIMTPIMLIVVGPLGNTVGNALGSGVIWLGDHLGFFAVALLAFLTPVMIATGTHSFAFPIIVASITQVGFDQLLMPSMCAENLAMAGAAFAIAMMSKDPDKRGEGISASLSAVLGISEPAMYGINLPSKYGFFGAMLGGAIGGAFAGIFHLRLYMIASSSVIGIPAMFGDKGIFNVIVGIATLIISFAAAAIITFVLAKTGIKGPEIKSKKKER
ncbi:MAG: PTS transporter subunit EIIC [Oliverpabstia sp.]